MVGVDVGFENPMFACLEIDYEEADADPTGITLNKIIFIFETITLSNLTYLI